MRQRMLPRKVIVVATHNQTTKSYASHNNKKIYRSVATGWPVACEPILSNLRPCSCFFLLMCGSFPGWLNPGHVWLRLPSVFSIYFHGSKTYVFLALVGVCFRIRVEFYLAELPEKACLQHEFGYLADCLRAWYERVIISSSAQIRVCGVLIKHLIK